MGKVGRPTTQPVERPFITIVLSKDMQGVIVVRASSSCSALVRKSCQLKTFFQAFFHNEEIMIRGETVSLPQRNWSFNRYSGWTFFLDQGKKVIRMTAAAVDEIPTEFQVHLMSPYGVSNTGGAIDKRTGRRGRSLDQS